MSRARGALLVALAIDNFGTGLFLPLTLVYLTRVVGLPLALAGTIVPLGTVAGLLVPPLAGRLTDRVGARLVVILAQLVQAAGVVAYLLAGSAVAVVVAAILVAAGQQAFYCALYALVADVAGDVPKDRPFAVVGMVRAASFGAGGLVAALLLTGYGTAGFRLALGTNALTYLVAALVLLICLRKPLGRFLPPACRLTAGPLRDRPYVALILISGLFGLSLDVFLIGVPVFVLEQLRGPSWLPGAIIALLTLCTSVGGTLALRLTHRLSRIDAMRFGSLLYAVWWLSCLGAVLVPPAVQPGYLLAVTLIIATANLVFGPRANALAEAAAPRAARGRYLAAFQYAFTAAQVLAPAVVALFSVAIWLPWLVVAVCAVLAVFGLNRLAARLPAHAVHPPRPGESGG
ncbi:MFS transporter [Amycolatopsis magusensis]|uniref:MFS family permease n=1 Tax=Amycolatopsis magusensis TaxID=882444 RepID=A0ABS4Q3A6_9PSEU|nr:MFS transporter [Amycolatopsis magusensis]MBP2186171.1 MFS family permease [Amycolatopsis magusensis]